MIEHPHPQVLPQAGERAFPRVRAHRSGSTSRCATTECIVPKIDGTPPQTLNGRTPRNEVDSGGREVRTPTVAAARSGRTPGASSADRFAPPGERPSCEMLGSRRLRPREGSARAHCPASNRSSDTSAFAAQSMGEGKHRVLSRPHRRRRGRCGIQGHQWLLRGRVYQPATNLPHRAIR